MNVLKRMRANRLARQLLAAETDASVAEARQELLASGASGIRAIFDALEGDRARGVALDVLEKLLTDVTLPQFVEALKSDKLAVVESATLALSNARGYDATPLLPLFSDSDVPRARLETILAVQVDSLKPSLLVQLLPDLSRDARVSVLRLLDKRVDQTIASAVVRLAQHPDWWLRQGMAKLLAKYPGGESVQ